MHFANSLSFHKFSMIPVSNMPLIVVLLAVTVALAGSFLLFNPKSSGLSAPKSILIFACTWLAVMATGVVMIQTTLNREPPDLVALKLAKIMVLFAIGVPFVTRLYVKWIGGKMTPAERAGGAVGVRAWLSPSNVIMAIVVAVMAWLVFDYPLVLMLLITFGLLLITPATHNIGAVDMPSDPRPEPFGSEREKVLAMLENGRITVEESADLLNALAASQPAAVAPVEPLSPARRLMMIGSCIVLAGFFFPWITKFPGKELARTMQSMQEGFGENFPLQMPDLSLPQVSPNLRVSAVGAEIEHGLGWMILALAITAALLPVFVKSMDRATLRLLQLLALGVGTVILLSVVSSSIRWVSFGLVATIAGYAVIWIGLLRERAASRVGVVI